MEPSVNDPKNPIRIKVVGDIIEDRHFYHADEQVVEVRELGGAAGLARLLAAIFEAAPGATPIDVRLGLKTPEVGRFPPSHMAYAVWSPSKPKRGDKDDQAKVWRAKLPMGHGRPQDPPPEKAGAQRDAPNFELLDRETPGVLALDDGGFDFRNRDRKDLWGLPGKNEPSPKWIVLKMSHPITQGDLWHELVGTHADKLITIVSAHELRDELALLRRSASWEGAIEDLDAALRSDPTLKPLTRSRHLIVTFSADGALWIDRDSSQIATLVFDPEHAEGEWAEDFDDQVFGYLCCMTAAVARAAAENVAAKAQLSFGRAMALGLGAMRELMENGHGRVTPRESPAGYPVKRLAAALAAGKRRFSIAAFALPRPEPTRRQWMMAEDAPGAPASRGESVILGLARQVVVNGYDALKGVPHARFGTLITADRAEIEALRGLRRLMRDYDAKKKAEKPLSIGVFGPPGAGKSFGVKQLAKEIFGETAWLEFNLSQFEGADELVGAFHRVRDLVLGGITPVVFWDEFDSGEYRWLQYLLAPMQDGRFQSGRLTHSIGKCVFAFAGATAYSFNEFEAKKKDPDLGTNFKVKKGPDFASRLDAYYNVLGPNPRSFEGKPDERDPDDIAAPLRRALLIRAWLAGKSEARLDIDSDLVDALLLAEKFTHGARSLEKLVKPLKEAQGEPIRRSMLPPHLRLAMHVEARGFYEILARNMSYRMSEMIDKIAEWIHKAWLEGDWPRQSYLDKPFADLAPIDKEDNRAAARRIPDVLALVGLGLAKPEDVDEKKKADEAQVKTYINFHIERLAEAEHEGWMKQRAKNGWVFGKERDDAKKHHPSMVPYAQLSEPEKDKDRAAVRNYLAQVKGAGYEIVWL
jgi:hypothetical protein